MPNFRYLAYSKEGKEVKGKIFAADNSSAVSLLKEQGLFVKEITPEKRGKFKLEKDLGLSEIFSNLSAMISSGVLVSDAVRSLSLETEGTVKELMEEIHTNIIKGLSLSAAMELRKDFFPSHIVSMVRAGEESGTLDMVLKNLSEFLEKEKELKDKVTSSLIYPAFMIFVSFILIFFVFVFVFPRITTIFQEQKIPLPLITRIFMAISSLLFNYWYVLIVILITIFFLGRFFYRKKAVQISRFLYEMPVRALRNLYITRLSRTLSLLLGGGVPIVKALEYAKDVSGNHYLSSELERIKDDVKEGKRISDVATFLPPLYLQMVMTGERTGDIVGALYKISEMAEREFKKSVDSFLKMLEPTIILTMGMVVGFMVISILLPIFQMNQVIR